MTTYRLVADIILLNHCSTEKKTLIFQNQIS